MERILPFKGLRYNKNIVGNLSAVLAPPYDVISPEQQKMLYDSHPFNVIRLEYGVKNDTDSDVDNRYTRSVETLTEWMHSGVLVPDRQPSFYVYGQEFTAPDGRQLFCKGIMCLVRLDEVETGGIIPHEETLSKAKADRLKLMTECGANFSPVYSLYTDETGQVAKLISESIAGTEEVSMKTADGITQKLWVVTDEQVVSGISEALQNKQLFIADGHNRYEAAINYRNAMRAKNPDHTGEEPYNYVMMFLTDMNDPGVVVLPIHRMVKNVMGYNEQAIISQLEQNFDVEKIEAEDIVKSMTRRLDENTDMPSFAMYTGKDFYYLLKLRDYLPADESVDSKLNALRRLDVNVLHSLIFGKVFDMTDADIKNQTYLDYTCDVSKAVDEVKNGNFQCSFMLNPTKISQIKEILLAKEKLPQKSTFFYPKPKTGIVINKLN